jgi:hypothetical protein
MSAGCSGEGHGEQDLSIEELCEEMLRILAAVRESQPHGQIEEAESLLESVIGNRGSLDVLNGEKWEHIKARLRKEGKQSLVPVVEAFAAKCRASTELRREGAKAVRGKVKAEVMEKYGAPHVRPEIETNEAVARRSLGDLGGEWFMKTPKEKSLIKEVRAATRDRGYYGYWFVDYGNGGFAAIPCMYGTSGIQTFIRMPGRAPLCYAKDLGGSILSRLPENPEREGWSKADFW